MITQDHLSNEMHRSARTIPVDPDFSKVLRRHRQRSRRRAGGAFTATVLVLAGFAGAAVVASGSLRDGETPTGPAADGPGPLVETDETSIQPALVEAEPLDLSWEVHSEPVPTGGAIGWVDMVQTPDGTIYALSTAPGLTADDVDDGAFREGAVYRTTDGRTWDAVLQGEQRHLSSLATRDGVLYAVSTSTGADGEIVAEVVSSADGAVSWTSVGALPESRQPDDPNGLLSSRLVLADVAVGEGGMVLQTIAYHHLDQARVQDLLGIDDSHDVYADGTNYRIERIEIEVGADGTEYHHPQGCELDSCQGPLSELGIDGSLEDRQSYHSVDGVSWEELDLGGDVAVEAVDGRLVALDYGNGTASSSLDGSTWTPLDTPDGIDEIVGTSLNGLVALERDDNGETTIVVGGIEAGHWTETPVTEIVADLGPDAVVQGRSGLLGVALYVTDHVNGRQLILTSPDGVVWTVDDPTRHGVPENAFVDTPFVGSDHLGFVLRLPSDAHGHSEVITLLGTPTR